MLISCIHHTGKFLSEKRNIKIHRTDTPLRKEVEVNIPETVPVIDAVDNVVTDKNGNIKKLKKQDKTSSTKEKQYVPKYISIY